MIFNFGHFSLSKLRRFLHPDINKKMTGLTRDQNMQIKELIRIASSESEPPIEK